MPSGRARSERGPEAVSSTRPAPVPPSPSTTTNTMTGPLQTELGGGVVFPGGVDADVGADAAEGPVAGLVGDRPVGGAAGVGVGDEAGAKAVRTVPAALTDF